MFFMDQNIPDDYKETLHYQPSSSQDYKIQDHNQEHKEVPQSVRSYLGQVPVDSNEDIYDLFGGKFLGGRAPLGITGVKKGIRKKFQKVIPCFLLLLLSP